MCTCCRRLGTQATTVCQAVPASRQLLRVRAPRSTPASNRHTRAGTVETSYGGAPIPSVGGITPETVVAAPFRSRRRWACPGLADTNGGAADPSSSAATQTRPSSSGGEPGHVPLHLLRGAPPARG